MTIILNYFSDILHPSISLSSFSGDVSFSFLWGFLCLPILFSWKDLDVEFGRGCSFGVSGYSGSSCSLGGHGNDCSSVAAAPLVGAVFSSRGSSGCCGEVAHAAAAPWMGVGCLCACCSSDGGGLLVCLLLLSCGGGCSCGCCSMDGRELHVSLLLLRQRQASCLAVTHQTVVRCMRLLILRWG
uniref:Uncharacterized protein n=1 Tax=Myotis myotis TaxID=51298 RepID=A0A7J7YDT5_MYOMY|nr:hypothetical protein mMyoMyo1_011061 [Myotis myotis]